jgi:hypothetical protein
MAQPKVWIDAYGRRWFPAEAIASMLGITPAEMRQPVTAGYLIPCVPPGQLLDALLAGNGAYPSGLPRHDEPSWARLRQLSVEQPMLRRGCLQRSQSCASTCWRKWSRPRAMAPVAADGQGP